MDNDEFLESTEFLKMQLANALEKGYVKSQYFKYYPDSHIRIKFIIEAVDNPELDGVHGEIECDAKRGYR